MNKIINPKSCYYHHECKIVQKLPDHKLEVLVDIGEEDQILIVVPSSDVDIQKQVIKPRSRKEFYCLVKDIHTSRDDIKNTLVQMIANGTIKTEKPEAVQSFFDDVDKDPETLVDEFRFQRDQGLFEFNLPNIAPQELRHNKTHKKQFHRR